MSAIRIHKLAPPLAPEHVVQFYRDGRTILHGACIYFVNVLAVYVHALVCRRPCRWSLPTLWLAFLVDRIVGLCPFGRINVVRYEQLVAFQLHVHMHDQARLLVPVSLSYHLRSKHLFYPGIVFLAVIA